MKDKNIACASCPIEKAERLCRNEEGKHPLFCPTENSPDLLEQSLEEYNNPDTRNLAYNASVQEAEGYTNRESGYDRVRPIKPRIVEIVELAHKMEYRRVGLAFCAGLAREAKIVEDFFKKAGLEVVSVICKVGRVPKEFLGLTDDQKIAIGQPESMCNPVLQATILNDSGTEFNILLGLCVGHDSLFFQHSQAPCTVLAVKDRVLAHNPLAAIYTLDSYYRSLKDPD